MCCAKHRQLPGAGSLIVTDEIGMTVGATQLEVSVVGRQPRVEHRGDGDATLTKNQCAWRLLAAVAGVALDTNNQERLRHSNAASRADGTPVVSHGAIV
jgi:hypothetical protein